MSIDIAYLSSGMYVNGVYLDGDQMVEWIKHHADRSHVVNADAALAVAFERTETATLGGVLEQADYVASLAGVA
jgi:CRISPR/Cas system-associated protein Cas10 (large subunit of type III CRISPR-Cas system)